MAQSQTMLRMSAVKARLDGWAYLNLIPAGNDAKDDVNYCAPLAPDQALRLATILAAGQGMKLEPIIVATPNEDD